MDSIFLVLAYILIGIGLLISVIGLPGIWAVTGGILIWSLVDGFVKIGIGWIIFFVFLSIISTFVDNIVVLLGAKKYGASKWGMLGAFIGLFIGLLIGNIIGMFVGMFLGAVISEMIVMKKESKDAIQVGIGTVVGYFAGIVVKFILAITIIVIWQIVIR